MKEAEREYTQLAYALRDATEAWRIMCKAQFTQHNHVRSDLGLAATRLHALLLESEGRWRELGATEDQITSTQRFTGVRFWLFKLTGEYPWEDD